MREINHGLTKPFVWRGIFQAMGFTLFHNICFIGICNGRYMGVVCVIALSIYACFFSYINSLCDTIKLLWNYQDETEIPGLISDDNWTGFSAYGKSKTIINFVTY